MAFTRRKASQLVVAASALATSVATTAPVLAQSINATQLSVVVAPTKIVGTSLGGEISASGSGLATGAIGTLSNTGAYTAGTAWSAGANTTFNLDLTVRAADIAATAIALGDGLVPAASTYGSQKGYWSNTGPGLGTLAISNQNAITITPGTNQGSTATAIASVSTSGLGSSSEIRRVATSSNDQATFDSTRQSARYQVGGSGLTEMTAANLASAALGATPTITVGSGAQSQGNVAFNKTENLRTGQAGATLTASTSNVTNPGYGTTTITTGGINAGGITAGNGNINSLAVVSGGGGTAATLSVIQSMTAF